jgi:methionyl-tRNA formyltransferase
MTSGSRVAERIRVVFLGNDPWSVASLERLAETAAIEIALVVTNPPRPAGRGARLRPTAVADAARRIDAPLSEVGSTSDPAVVARLEAAAPDVLVVVAYGELLRAPALAAAHLGAVNVHLSLLPRWRGAAPVQHAILAGDAITGVTIMQIDSGLDTGPVLARGEVRIGSDEDAGALGQRLSQLGAELLPPSITELAEGRASPQPQEGEVTMAPKLRPGERRLLWDQPASDLVRRVRAFAPEPGASTTWRGTAFKILRATLIEDVTGPPGAIASVEGDMVVVGAGSGAIGLLEVAPAGRRHMAATEWARGARPTAGETFV